ncbi:transmembrane amino acid transporter family protein [Artemisia annua]|uniref:Transmembrane amino acid transporter family protein n=1 Tax=Artemisia annua TaxID=35608 RepID=A0A2U1LHD8_ARTAN|nr:transmembrane amino acid transporter family protein [Artemisia annua]PWA48411.1 transmembrane amino acid transporter family protein [Artemisia annua]
MSVLDESDKDCVENVQIFSMTTIVGAGVLGLPYTFKKTGYATGTITVFAVAYFTNHCMMLLVKTRKKMETKNGFSKINSFGDLGFVVAGPIGRTSVDVMIVLSQAGFCVSYLIFVSNTLVNIFNLKPLASSLGNDASSTIFGLSWKSFYIWACFPFQLGLNSIPTLTHLAPLSIFADVVDIGAMGVVMVEEVMIYLNTRPVLEAFGGFSVFFYGIGVAVYAFEGIGMVLPLESEMEKKEKFGSVLGITISFIALMFASFGVFGYFAFGDETKDIITTNLGEGWLSGVVQLGLCFNLFVTFPVMMNPVFEVFERTFCEGRYTLWVRWGMVLVVSLVALLVPNFADFLSLVGSSVCIILGFVLPALFHLMVCKDEVGILGWFKDGAFIVFGVLLAITGTWTSLLEILATKA